MLQIRVRNRKDAYQYVRIRLDTSEYAHIRPNTLRYVRIRLGTSEYVGYISHTVEIRLHTYTAMWLVVGIPAIRVVLGGSQMSSMVVWPMSL